MPGLEKPNKHLLNLCQLWDREWPISFDGNRAIEHAGFMTGIDVVSCRPIEHLGSARVKKLVIGVSGCFSA